MSAVDNVDLDEIDKFNELAHRWWDTDGDFKPLHDINPCRLSYIQEKADLAGGPMLDVGCGGGILAESVARLGFDTTGIDMAEKALGVAKLHALESESIRALRGQHCGEICVVPRGAIPHRHLSGNA